MGRPSVSAERRRQVLEAAIRSLAANGLAGTSLDRIAEEAGMARGHIRHFAGNRDDILTAAAVLFYFGEVPDLDTNGPVISNAASFLPEKAGTIAEALDYLFGDFAEPDAENTVALALVDAARTNPRIHAIVLRAYTGSQNELAALLAQACPEAAPAACRNVAYGILTIALGNVFMADIEVSSQRTAVARQSAELLVATLSETLSPRAG
ncbi:TetR/AcrR family transcriptional regulator [Arthrobacter koreensis]|uniref:TetR/AcrR family transcriptional regulator n=1 Tax=Arthrobacter koreensis TaxID=199136 RepID=UPI002DB5B180|nr:TetR family transcriptional regulator [Arthrobacter koreensis]MEB7505761.1 TetR/AcrR family transcriptional regulator [Arthrobacter koreensis]